LVEPAAQSGSQARECPWCIDAYIDERDADLLAQGALSLVAFL